MLKAFRRCPIPLRWKLTHSTAPTVTVRCLQSRAFIESQPASIVTSQYIRSFHQPTRLRQDASAAVSAQSIEVDDGPVAPGPATKFIELAERGLVHEKIIDTITRGMGLETMTQVQSLTLDEALKSKDVLAQAKTGTGKTIGFLLPVLQNIITEDPSLIKKQFQRRVRYGGKASDIRALIISPTRELAEQIAVEAKKLVSNIGVVVQTAVGGTQKRLHLSKMQQEGCHILVGTPGRIKDIFSDEYLGVSAPKISAFVLDEADRLLDQGFWPEIQAIQELLPPLREKDRQTLMFSATVPRDVVQLARSTMKSDLHYVRTVQQDDVPTQERVKQKLVVVPSLENQVPAVLELCDREIKAANAAISAWKQDPNRDMSKRPRPFKAIVYHNATVETSLNSSMFIQLRMNERRAAASDEVLFGGTRVYEIHGRLTQNARTNAADQFRQADSALLMSSDVTARGMDFPGVTHVLQIGLPVDRDTYIHRLGRTARAGAEGEGWLFLPAPALQEARARLGQLPLQRDNTLDSANVDYLSRRSAEDLPEMTDGAKKYFDLAKTAAATLPPDRQNFDETYMAFLGTYQWLRDKTKMVAMMNSLASVQWGLTQPPAIPSGLANKLNLNRTTGVRTGPPRSRPDSGFGRGDRDSFGGGGRGSFGGDRGSFGGSSRGGFDRPPPPPGGFGDRPQRSNYGGRDGGSGGFRRSSGGDSFGDRRGGFGDRRGGSSFGREERSSRRSNDSF